MSLNLRPLPMEPAAEAEFFFNGSLNMPMFMVLYLLIYVFSYTKIFKTWGKKRRLEASSCAMSLAHGTPVVAMSLYVLFLSSPLNQSGFASPNTRFQSFVLDYSIAYFSMDLIHYLAFIPEEVLFIVHHVATLFVLATCRYVVQHGAYALLSILVLAEITSMCQNAWTIAGLKRDDGDAMAAKVHASISPFFYVFYTATRGFAAPWLVCKMVRFFLSGVGDGTIPRWSWVAWMIVTSAGIVVSWLWVSNLWIAYYRERSKQKQKKV